MASASLCCKQIDWTNAWDKIDMQWNKESNIGFDLWAAAHGLRDCLLIDHLLWRQQKMHSKLLAFIQQFCKVTSTCHPFSMTQNLE